MIAFGTERQVVMASEVEEIEEIQQEITQVKLRQVLSHKTKLTQDYYEAPVIKEEKGNQEGRNNKGRKNRRE